jgi:YggT family protein
VGALLFGLDTFINALRGGFFAFALAVAVFCALDWLVRARRIHPFSRFATFLRTNIRPLMAPIERRVLRAGGNTAMTPWWTLVIVVLAGIVVLSLLDFVREQLALAYSLMDGGASGMYKLAVSWTFGILRLALIGRVLLSWVRPSPFAWYVRASYALTEWYLRPMRGFIPLFGMMDVTPILAYLLLGLLQGFLMRLA